MKAITSLLLTLLMLQGCHDRTPEVTAPDAHVQTSQELQIIMRKFNNLIYEHFQSELDRDEKRIEYTKDIIPLVDQLVENSRRLQQVKTTRFTAQEQQGFRTLAQQLERQSKQLKKLVGNYQTEAISQSLNEIEATCTQCHARLR